MWDVSVWWQMRDDRWELRVDRWKLIEDRWWLMVDNKYGRWQMRNDGWWFMIDVRCECSMWVLDDRKEMMVKVRWKMVDKKYGWCLILDVERQVMIILKWWCLQPN